MIASRQHTGLLQSAVEQATEAILMTEGAPLNEPGPRITYVNQAFTEMTGYEADEILGETPRILQGPATETWVLDTLRRRLDAGEPFEGEAINYRKDGTPFVNHWSISPVTNDNGVVTHWLSIQRDVSEKRELSKRLLEGREKERRRFAQEIHDEVGGRLTSLQMLVDRAQVTVRDGDCPAALFSQVEEQIQALSSVVRTRTGRFSSRVLRDFGLAEAVSTLAQECDGQENVTVDLHNDLDPNERLSPLLERIAFRVIRAALQRAAHRTDTHTAQVLLNKTTQRLRVHVIDQTEGGHLTSETDTSWNDLPRMKKRIEQLNGTLSVHSVPDAGTRLTVTLPRALVSLNR